MKLALHRSITFWSGILVMTFVCWTWWDSTRYLSQGSIGRVIIGSHGRTVSLAPMSPKTPVLNYWGRTPFAKFSNKLEVPAFPRPMWLRGRETIALSFSEMQARRKLYEPLDYWKWRQFIAELNPPSYWQLVIPHWLILLAFAVLWIALLLWRARRRKRSLKV